MAKTNDNIILIATLFFLMKTMPYTQLLGIIISLLSRTSGTSESGMQQLYTLDIHILLSFTYFLLFSELDGIRTLFKALES